MKILKINICWVLIMLYWITNERRISKHKKYSTIKLKCQHNNLKEKFISFQIFISILVVLSKNLLKTLYCFILIK